MVDSIIATQAREGIKTTREQEEAAYAKSQSRPNSSRIAASPVSTERVELYGALGRTNGVLWQGGSTRHSEAAAEGRGATSRFSVAGSEGLLEGLTARFGTPCAYDGRYCVWTTRDNGRTRDSFDIHDIANRLGVHPQDVLDLLPDFTPVKRGRVALQTGVKQ